MLPALSVCAYVGFSLVFVYKLCRVAARADIHLAEASTTRKHLSTAGTRA